MDAMQKITGSFKNANPCQNAEVTGDGAFAYGNFKFAVGATGMAAVLNTGCTFDSSRVARTAVETRPINFTVRIWKRIA